MKKAVLLISLLGFCLCGVAQGNWPKLDRKFKKSFLGDVTLIPHKGGVLVDVYNNGYWEKKRKKRVKKDKFADPASYHKLYQSGEKGFEPIYPQPRKGAGDCLVNFYHPKHNHGVLTELSQPPS